MSKVKHDKSLEQTNEYGVIRESKEGKGAYELISPFGLKELALVYEEGAVAHGDRNWEKGAKFGKTLQSAIRHIYQRMAGCQDERHLAQAAWNLFAVIHYEEMIKRELLPKELDDLPSYVENEYPFDIPDLPSLKQLNEEYWKEVVQNISDIPEWMTDELATKILQRKHQTEFPWMKYSFEEGKFYIEEIPFEEVYEPPKPHTAYFSHHIRGVKGDDATDEEMDANREDAIKVCNQLRKLLPEWKIYCPAEVDEVVSELFKSKAIGEKEILDADCKILERREVLFAYVKDNHISRGMKIEMDHAYKVGISVFQFSVWNEYVENALQHIRDYGVSK